MGRLFRPAWATPLRDEQVRPTACVGSRGAGVGGGSSMVFHVDPSHWAPGSQGTGESFTRPRLNVPCSDPSRDYT